MSIPLLNKEEAEIIKTLRAMPKKECKVFLKELENFREKMEAKEDEQDIIKRAKEPTIPVNKVWETIGDM